MEVDRIIDTIVSLKQYKIILLNKKNRSNKDNKEQFKIVLNSINKEYYQLIKSYMREERVGFSKINLTDFRDWYTNKNIKAA